MNIIYYKPCPFCGSSPILMHESIEGYTGEEDIYMKCASLQCGVTLPNNHYNTLTYSKKECEEKAIQAWNYRYNFKNSNSNTSLFDAYVLGVLDAARKAIVNKYNEDINE